MPARPALTPPAHPGGSAGWRRALPRLGERAACSCRLNSLRKPSSSSQHGACALAPCTILWRTPSAQKARHSPPRREAMMA
eukprot:23099-Prymnesium_polylepis.1